jgi:hypothetical protein
MSKFYFIKKIKKINYNSCAQLGDGSFSNSLIPKFIPLQGVLSGKTIKTVSSSWYYTCVLANDQQVYCWGKNE